VKRFIISVILIVVGWGMWGALSRTARFSMKKWDATFETVLRHTLSESGIKNEDVLFSVNQLQKDAQGQWVERRITLKNTSAEKVETLKKSLEDAGASVSESTVDGVSTLLVKRGSRVYQEIKFEHSRH
jgi:hypothetical protein